MYPVYEKRKHVRKPCCEKIFLRRKINGRLVDGKPIYLRDISDGGVSGTYFGDDIPKKDEEIIIFNSIQGPKKAKLAWSHKSIDSIYMLAFSFEENTMINN